MKTLHKHTIAGILLIAFTLFLPLSDTKAQGPISFDVFYHELAPYGNWVQNPGFGQVWVPNAQSGFHPYVTRGHWIMTDYGNTWVSDLSWGWAPFHYDVGIWMTTTDGPGYLATSGDRPGSPGVRVVAITDGHPCLPD